MNYIPNPNASGWRGLLLEWRRKIVGKCRYIQQKMLNKTRLMKVNNRLNGFVMAIITLIMLLSMLFSISLIITVGIALFIINAGWYCFSGLFSGESKRKLS